jgi:hypothetical protein
LSVGERIGERTEEVVSGEDSSPGRARGTRQVYDCSRYSD